MADATPPATTTTATEEKHKHKSHHKGHHKKHHHHHHHNHSKKADDASALLSAPPAASAAAAAAPLLGPPPPPDAVQPAQMTPPPVAARAQQLQQPPRLAPPPALLVPPSAAAAAGRRPSNPPLPLPSLAPAGRRPSNPPPPSSAANVRSRSSSFAPAEADDPTTQQQQQPAEPKFAELRPWLEAHRIGGETAAALLHAGVALERLTAIDDGELAGRLGMPLCARLDVHGAVWLSRRWLPRVPAAAAAAAVPEAAAQKPRPQTPPAAAAAKPASPQATAPTAPLLPMPQMTAPLGVRPPSAVLGASKLAPPPKLALPTLPTPKTADELLAETLQMHEAAVCSCQGLLLGKICDVWYHERNAARRKSVDLLAEQLSLFAANLSAYASIVANPDIIGDDLAKTLASFTCIGREWAKLAEELRGKRWTRQALASDVFTRSTEAWVAPLRFFINTRGQSLFTLEMRAKKVPKIASFFAACKAQLEQRCTDVDTFVDPLVAFEEWISRQIRGLEFVIGRLLDTTHSEHPDIVHLEVVVKKIRELVARDKELRVEEEEKRINSKTVEAAAERMTDAPEDIVAWGRALMEEGSAELFRGKRGPEPVHYFLFSDMLVVGTGDSKKTHVLEAVGLPTATLRDVPDGTDLGGVSAKHVWAVDSVFFTAKSAEEKQKLLGRVRDVAAQAKEQRIKDHEHAKALQLGFLGSF